MNTEFHVIIPARYQSTRFPGKLLQQLHGVSILERVYRQAKLAKPKSIIIATDSEQIAEHASDFAAVVEMTLPEHETGTDRIAEIVARGPYASDDIIVNVQGDEPFIAPELITQVALSLRNTAAPMATLCWPVENFEQLCNPNVVKVVRTEDNHALYFSRSPIPLHRDNPRLLNHTFRHIGLYAYRAGFLLDYVSWPQSPLEQAEALEQLRALWFGTKIKVDTACVEPLQDINTKEDLAKALLVLDKV